MFTLVGPGNDVIPSKMFFFYFFFFITIIIIIIFALQ